MAVRRHAAVCTSAILLAYRNRHVSDDGDRRPSAWSVINWFARDADRRGLIAVLGGNLVVQILSLVIVVRTMMLGAGTKVAPGIAIHVVLGAFCGFFLAQAISKRSA
jgi:hypothetical protein